MISLFLLNLLLLSPGQTDWQVVASGRKLNLRKDRLMDVTKLALTWVGWPNGEKLALDQSERKSWQVDASARNARPNGVASRLKFSTLSFWPGL